MKLPKCQMCGRFLKAEESIKNGVGPECADRMARFTGACGTSVDEIGTLTLIDDPTVAKWLRCFAGAMRNHRPDLATRFIQAARREAAAYAQEIAEKEAA